MPAARLHAVGPAATKGGWHPSSLGERAVDAGGSVTVWLGRLKAEDAGAARPLWQAYFGRLVELARRKLGGRPLAAADEENAALSAFDSFCRRAREGRFPTWRTAPTCGRCCWC